MANPINIDIDYYSGDELQKSFQITKNGSPLDLSADTLVMQIKKRKTDLESQLVATLSTTDGTITVFGDNNDSYILSGDYDLQERDYFYDIERTNVKETIQYGLFKVTGDVTRTG